jgi:sigma-B regulation protein RsbU (phosphoserine phosphatase)
MPSRTFYALVLGALSGFALGARATPLGLLESQFSSKAFPLEAGYVFVAYTDGITEAEGPDNEPWGMERLENLLRSCRNRTPEQIIRRILDEVAAFANGRSQRDDVTLLVFGVKY